MCEMCGYCLGKVWLLSGEGVVMSVGSAVIVSVSGKCGLLSVGFSVCGYCL